MTSSHEAFWGHTSYAVVGHSARARFPKLTYGALKARGKRVVPVDPSSGVIEGDRAYASLAEIPDAIDGVVIEAPPDEAKGWVEQAVKKSVPRIWFHMFRDTPEALALAKEHGIEVCTGTCAVQYLTTGLSPHAVHRAIRKVLGRY
jgi:predicted CoA-binding protein